MHKCTVIWLSARKNTGKCICALQWQGHHNKYCPLYVIWWAVEFFMEEIKCVYGGTLTKHVLGEWHNSLLCFFPSFSCSCFMFARFTCIKQKELVTIGIEFILLAGYLTISKYVTESLCCFSNILFFLIFTGAQ